MDLTLAFFSMSGYTPYSQMLISSAMIGAIALAQLLSTTLLILSGPEGCLLLAVELLLSIRFRLF